ncbi:MAG: biotin carboxylase [Proteobacteria bacterium]|nr:biotin carboxylase [Pseudomonadota bacterium]
MTPSAPANALVEQDLCAPVHGSVIAIEVQPGQAVARGQVLLLIESMKMEVPLEAPWPAEVLAVRAAVGEVAAEGQGLLRLRRRPEGDAAAPPAAAAALPASPAGPRPELQRLLARRALLADAARPEAMARRHATGLRSARANLADLLDDGSFTEVGALMVAAQRSRRSLDDLQRNTPADGLVCGTGTVAGRPVAALAYDYTVLAGTQGMNNHAKSDRVLELAARQRLPVLWFLEGGGGRPGDVDSPIVAGLHCTTFGRLAALSGVVPRLGLVAGRCFAGNAALLGCCDLIIAVQGASIGMGGPAMIEGGGLGKVDADAVGPVPVLAANGVIDLVADSEAEAVRHAKALLALLTAPLLPAGEPGDDPQTLRDALPPSRNALYEPRRILQTVADAGTLIELRRDFGIGVITALARIGGRAVALAASNPRHLGGALDAPACDKLARFMQLADAFGLPLVSFVDSPGFMVGPESEKTAMVRHAARLFVNAAALRVPVAAVLLRRGYGLGAMALSAGHFHAPVATAAWPTGEFGGMGLEGAVRLGFRKELEAAPPAEREALFQRLLQEAIARGEALNMAAQLEIDDVIDPAETRDWLVRVLTVACAAPLPPRRAFVDAW